MSIRRGSRIASRDRCLALGFADPDNAVALDTNDAGAKNHPGIDVDQTRGFEGQYVAHS